MITALAIMIAGGRVPNLQENQGGKRSYKRGCRKRRRRDMTALLDLSEEDVGWIVDSMDSDLDGVAAADYPWISDVGGCTGPGSGHVRVAVVAENG